MKIIPREEKFFELFKAIAANIDEAAIQTAKMLDKFDNVQEDSLVIRGLEHRGDEMTHNIVSELNKTFITPFDREDIHNLATTLDDVLDLVDAVANRIVLFKLPPAIKYAKQLADIICLQTKELVKALADLKKYDQVMQHCIDIRRLETEGDRIYHIAIADLFENEKDAIALIKQKEILETLEQAIDKCQTVTTVLESIIVKNA